jgi:hypothetical protein
MKTERNGYESNLSSSLLNFMKWWREKMKGHCWIFLLQVSVAHSLKCLAVLESVLKKSTEWAGRNLRYSH